MASSLVTTLPWLGQDFEKNLLVWYDQCQRSLPWRQTKDPYGIMISEFMLQQTTVATVIPYFHNWISRWPTLVSLSKATLDEVLHTWQGLGYYTRARNLWKLAQVTTEIPSNRNDLLKLPGIGPYTASAIASIAFNAPYIPVDGNIHRVFCRLWAKNMDKAEMMKLFTVPMPIASPSKFTQALMDLGATICKPKNPLCNQCPVSFHCQSFKNKTPEDYPKKMPKKESPQHHTIAFVVRDSEGRLLLRRRPDQGLLAHLMEVPNAPWREKVWALSEAKSALAPLAFKNLKPLGRVQHIFTHLKLIVDVYGADIDHPHDYKWESPEKSALPTLMRKIIKKGTSI